MGNWNGSGAYVRSYNWQNDAAANIPITASRTQPDAEDMATNGFGNCLTRDGQGVATANLPMAGFRHIGVSDGAAQTDYASVGQVQRSATTYVVGAGTGDAIAGNYTPNITALPDGITLLVRAPGANTVTNPTFGPNSLTPRTIMKRGGNPLIVGEYAAGQVIQLTYYAGTTHWELVSAGAQSATASLDTIGSTQGMTLYRGASAWSALSAGTDGYILRTKGAGANPEWDPISSILDTVSATPGKVLQRGSSVWSAVDAPAIGSQAFPASGTFTIPANATATSTFKFTVVGGGGGGGGTNATGQMAASGGGSGGCGYATFKGFTAGASVTITDGTAGAAGSTAGGDGGSGGSSKVTFSAVDIITSTGGAGGGGATAGSTQYAAGAAGTFSATVGASGLTLVDSSGLLMQAGSIGSWANSDEVGGRGGSTPFGAGGADVPLNSAGIAGVRGGGGSGAANSSAVGRAGGAGGVGFVLVEWVL